MNKYFEAKIKYRKTNEQGVSKVVTEAYLLDAISFTEAESRINEEIKQYIGEEFKVTNIRVTNYSEVHPQEDADSWFKSKVTLFSYDEESGKEQKTNIYLLVQANDTKEAYDKTIVAMKSTMGEYSIPAVSLTNIVDFFPYLTETV
jgi:hypothetical protein